MYGKLKCSSSRSFQIILEGSLSSIGIHNSLSKPFYYEAHSQAKAPNRPQRQGKTAAVALRERDSLRSHRQISTARSRQSRRYQPLGQGELGSVYVHAGIGEDGGKYGGVYVVSLKENPALDI
jgi:hypothetical protein